MSAPRVGMAVVALALPAGTANVAGAAEKKPNEGKLNKGNRGNKGSTEITEKPGHKASKDEQEAKSSLDDVPAAVPRLQHQQGA